MLPAQLQSQGCLKRGSRSYTALFPSEQRRRSFAQQRVTDNNKLAADELVEEEVRAVLYSSKRLCGGHVLGSTQFCCPGAAARAFCAAARD